MKFPIQAMQRFIAGCIVLLLSAPFSEPAVAQQEQSQPAQQQVAANDSREMPDAPAPAAQQNQGQQQSSQQQNPPADPNGQEGNSPAVGTAAAPLEKPSGVAASRPAGAAIAPAKQRRVRTFLISVGVVIGAGVAIGTVAALSHASPSRP
ncbi:MAG TPA: hypothetical protein VKR52_01060 [Terracidiphilus sp.]|nr:hypothetical protein [Terracidiphilus sp.]